MPYRDGDHTDVLTAPQPFKFDVDATFTTFPEPVPLSILTPVHPLESTARHGYCSPHFAFRHSGWANRRRRIYDAMTRVSVSPNRTARFASCGAGFWVLRKRDDHDEIKLVPDVCHDRFCQPCGHARAATIRANIQTRISPTPHRFLTLTLKNDGEPLSVLLDKLMRSFKKLRSSVFWKDKVRGGAAFIELTANEENGRWHPHLHCILEGKYLCQHVLRRLWLSITGDSFVIDIRLIRHADQVRDYVTKYSTKQLKACIINHAYLLEEAVVALQGRKLCYTFGSWSRWPLLKHVTDEDYETFCHANELPYRMDGPDDYATRIHRRLCCVIQDDAPMTFSVHVDD